ncbi:ABC transporter, ATP-binding protein [Parvimonas sp. oral taxon 110 str. F0139]|uniref:ATP-binding cassette domain-containing protein n=1 Tax=Parvimonas sp. TaxID=1944660 RepID=UPI00020DDDC9|nr:ATP-binding cassette domain-containing protein [Parvimonas sp.]EGL35787.1 ABC transporter, ATP-binding protein [Parvimonas sp. oral taxon 110 str. F0139]MBF1295005.1 ATP-binding cassette domain-containing protein [Parvimonas sp.]MBF1299705.1 ATP-binding cassette domain-containing protein [Parvimonas sp.]
MENILQVKNLTKMFGQNYAVNNVDMNIQRGDIYGFIGRNGAGKTTLIRILLGLCEKNSGEIELFGSSNLNEGRDKTGCIIENPALFPKMTAKDNIIAQSKAVGVKLSSSEIDDLLSVVGLESTGKKKAKDFSLGMKQRLSIALALVGNPEFLVLDEPTNGLDPEGIRDVRNLILRLNKEKNITVLVSSHILGELHKLATRYGVIDKGRLIKEFTAKELDEKTEDGFEIKVKEDDVQSAEDFLKESNIDYSFDKEKCKFTISKNENSDEILKQITAKGVIPTSYGFKNVDLEDYFMELIGGKHE